MCIFQCNLQMNKHGAVLASGLTPYWIRPPREYSLGFGVTAWSLEDALDIIYKLDYGEYLPDDLAELQIIEGITFGELDQGHVVPNMGPMNLRGMWYPFVAVGFPRWAEERQISR